MNTRIYHEGQQVRATRQVTEGGFRTPGNRDARFPDPRYIHAEAGDVGTVEYVDDDGYPTVRFERTGTATVVGRSEVEVLP